LPPEARTASSLPEAVQQATEALGLA
jgi:hypothetical protein